MDVNQSKEDSPPEVGDSSNGGGGDKGKRPRPANGFLGFCHRHRHIVSRRNKKLENRLITKILGNWWKFLPDAERKVYEDQAREFKALFMEANPDYKWYTPHESTGHTPVTRQSNRRGKKLEGGVATSGGAITPGKLADVSQMGGLSSLMLGEQPKKRGMDPANCTNYIAEEHDYLETKPTIINNNTITMQDLELEQLTEAGNDYSQLDKTLFEDEEPEVLNGEEANELEGQGADLTPNSQKRKLSKPKKNILGAPQSPNGAFVCPSFKDFMKGCPIYSYDLYLARKAEVNSSNKRSLAKKHKWRQALSEYGVKEANQEQEKSSPSRRRRKRRVVGPSRGPKKSPSDGAPITQQQKLTALFTPQELVPPITSRPHSPFPNHLELLATAAETVENNRRLNSVDV